MYETLTFRAKEDELQALREQNELYADIIAKRGVCRNCRWYDDDFHKCFVETDEGLSVRPMPADGFCSLFESGCDNEEQNRQS